ncbi:MAG: DUF4433 domain-containing protein [Clostridiales bacterium]|jgi:hypothetical protein|nr:DUF4433 domain-containing protein [Clostridiales bacterium]
MIMPENPKIYHIVHIDRLLSIVCDGYIWCDSISAQYKPFGTTIGMSDIKNRRRFSVLDTYSNLCVGDCVPFYFCPRSVMLYMLYQSNHPNLNYNGGQELIIHLEADLQKVVTWAKQNQKRWFFTLSNAGAVYFEIRNKLSQLNELNWDAIQANYWQDCKEGKQAEFLIEKSLAVSLIDRIGVYSFDVLQQVTDILANTSYYPQVAVKREWYY